MIAEQAGTSPEVRAALARLRAAYERQAYSRDGWSATAADVDLVLGALRERVAPLETGHRDRGAAVPGRYTGRAATGVRVVTTGKRLMRESHRSPGC